MGIEEGASRESSSLGENEAVNQGLLIFMTTVDPRNTPCLRNLLSSGYEIVSQATEIYMSLVFFASSS